MIDAHPTAPVIISTHSYAWDQPGAEGRTGNAYGTNPEIFPYPQGPPGAWSQTASGNSGEEIWSKLVRDNPQIFMVLNGHWSQEEGEDSANRNIGEWFQTSTNAAGLLVYEMLSDYQDDANGGDGWLRLIEFRPGQATDGSDVLLIRTYSPVLDLQDDGLANHSAAAFKPNDSSVWDSLVTDSWWQVDDDTAFTPAAGFNPKDSQFYFTTNFTSGLQRCPSQPPLRCCCSPPQA
jgi:hypothetical protein